MMSRVNEGEKGFDETDAPPRGLKPKKANETENAKDVFTYPQDPSMPRPDFYYESFCYNMKTEPRGYCVIINNEEFEIISQMQDRPRRGTNVDANRSEELFMELGFTVRRENNKTVREMRQILMEASAADYSKLSAFVCIILSHGKQGKVFGIDGPLDISDLTSMFRGKNLAGKPKLFFIQACQGNDYMNPVEPDAGCTETDGPDYHAKDISFPSEADFLYAYSTVPGYYAWRHSKEGSWFIQAIVKVFREYAHEMDVVHMLTRVNDIVSQKISATNQPLSDNKRQIPSIVSQLRKDLHLFPIKGQLKSLLESNTL